jgi:hypothetical protein
MATASLFRKLALSLADAIESAHMGHPDFRVMTPDGKGRIFATLSGEPTSRGVLMLTPDQQASFCEELPDVFEPVQGGWGRMGSTYVHLDAIQKDTLLGALTTAHRNAVAKLESTRAKRSAPPRKPAASGIARKRSRAQPKMDS